MNQFNSMIIKTKWHLVTTMLCLVTVASSTSADAATGDIVVRGERVYPVSGPVIPDGVVVIRGGKIRAIGPAAEVTIPEGLPIIEGRVVLPGLIDAHSVVGLAGMLNQDEDQDQLDPSSEIQPQLRAIDAYSADDPLVAWVRGFGVTTLHTGHAPGALVSGQTMILKTNGRVDGDAVLNPAFAIASTLGTSAQRDGKDSPGTRGKMVAMLRQKWLDARAYQQKMQAGQSADDEVNDDEDGKKPDPPQRDLEMEALVAVLDGRMKWLVTADRAIDIRNAMRLADEFSLPLIIDSGSEANLMTQALLDADVPVIVHPTMARAYGDRENMTMQNAAKLADAGVTLALQSGYENYVPKTRVVLFESGVAAAHGLGKERAIAAMTLDAAKLLGVDDRIGSLEIGKDGDVAIYDGDPLEYTTHCTSVVIEGVIVSEGERMVGG